jgi:hypothetical protein
MAAKKAKRKDAKSKSGGSKLKAKKAGGKRLRAKGKSKKLRKQKKSSGIEFVKLEPRGLGTRAGVGSGDMQDIPTIEDASSESVEELLEEGQAFEAAFVSGVEDAPPADKAPVRTRTVPADDVPPEYDERRPTLATEEED